MSQDLTQLATRAIDEFNELARLRAFIEICSEQVRNASPLTSIETIRERVDLLLSSYLTQAIEAQDDLEQTLKQIHRQAAKWQEQESEEFSSCGMDDSIPTAVIESGSTWLLPLPKDGFTVPKFTFGQTVRSLQDDAWGRIIGMEFAKEGSELAHAVSSGWHYTITLTVLPVYLRKFTNKKWKPIVEIFPESDLIMICGGEN